MYIGYVGGFLLWCGVVVIIFILTRLGSVRFVDIENKLNRITQMLLHISFGIIGFFIYFAIDYGIKNSCVKYSESNSVLMTFILMLVWYASYNLPRVIILPKQKRHSSDEELKKAELNPTEISFCNMLCLIGAIIIGVIYAFKMKNSSYLGVTTTALVIIMNSWISIQTVQLIHFKTYRSNVWGKFKESCMNADKLLIVVGVFYTVILTVVACFGISQIITKVINQLTIGFGVGIVGFILCLISLKMISSRTGSGKRYFQIKG